MLVEFTVGNFLSFKEKKTLSLKATSVTEYKGSTFSVGSDRVLKSVVLYGANSSGKSNLIRAMSIMKLLVMTSVEKSSISKNKVIPFLLSTETEKEPSFFEVVFLIGKTRYRYGFELNAVSVHGEWLFEMKGKKEVPLFIREKDGIGITKKFNEGEGLESKTRDNALFLAVADQFNGVVSGRIMKWFNDLVTISGLRHENYQDVTYSLLKEETSKKKLLDFFKNLDLGFDEMRFKKDKLRNSLISLDLSENVVAEAAADYFSKSTIRIETIHKKFDEHGERIGNVSFDLRERESSGTNKVIDISGPIFDVLLTGGILVVDELDAKLHPLMTAAITNLFNSAEYNVHNAQLIFATHDTNLLSYGRFRRDQIYFLEKDKFEATDLYSLVEYEEDGVKIRKDRSFEKDYIAGRYGAIPFIGDFDKVLSDG